MALPKFGDEDDIPVDHWFWIVAWQESLCKITSFLGEL